jgi:hypothetical protein
MPGKEFAGCAVIPNACVERKREGRNADSKMLFPASSHLRTQEDALAFLR